jgi:thymidylate synthase
VNATQCMLKMYEDIRSHRGLRTVLDTSSPRRDQVVEAPLFSQYRITDVWNNTPQVAFDRRWAIANTLHFFAATESAKPLLKYNKRAAEFLTLYRSTARWAWHGAYGAIAMPQVWECIKLLHADLDSRRAIVSMHNDAGRRTLNTPSCWNLLQFLSDGSKLHMGVSQRSLGMRVFPYDCVVLTNLLALVATNVRLDIGDIVWTVGSVHATEVNPPGFVEQAPIHLPANLLSDSMLCWRHLEDEDLWTTH